VPGLAGRRGSEVMALEPEAAAESALDAGGLTAALVRRVPEAAADLVPGTRLGDVTIVRFVAEGGMGRVYEALQGMPCRTVAVKVMRPGVFSATAIRRFEHEAHVLGRLTHPGIARIFCVGRRQVSGGESPYLVIEFIEDARSITAHASARQLSIRDRVRLFREVCQAIAHGHQRGIIHRDLKPGNILVDATGQVKIIDFGVARSTDVDVALTTMHTELGQLVGTIQYMSPEQFDGVSHDIDVRADVYSLGVVLYELLVDRLPYDVARRPVYDVARVVREVPPATLSVVDRRLRGELDTIVAKCLEKEPTRRYSSAAELEADLGRWLSGEPILATPPRLRDAVVRLARRHRLAALATASTLLAFLLGGIGISIFAVQAARERAVAVREQARADAEAETSRQRLYSANLSSLQASLGNRNQRAARQFYGENLTIIDGPPPLEMRILGSGLDEAAVVLEFENRTVREVAYSPAGDRLWVETVVRLAQPTMGGSTQGLRGQATTLLESTRAHIECYAVGPQWRYEPVPVAEPPRPALRMVRGNSAPDSAAAGGLGQVVVAQSTDERLMAVHAPDGRVRIVDRAMGRDVALIDGHRGRLESAAFSPDAHRLLIRAPTGSLKMWDTDSGRLVAVIVAGQAGRTTLHRYEFSPTGGRLALIESEGGREGRLGVRLLATTDGRQILAHKRNQRLAAPAGSILQFSRDGSRLLATLYDELQVWDAESGASVGRLDGRAAFVTAAAFSHDGGRIAFGLNNGALRLWDGTAVESEWDLMGHEGAILSLAFHPEGSALASGANDGTVRIWALDSPGPRAAIPAARGLNAVAFSPDGALLAVAARDQGEVTLWNSRSVERLHTLACPGSAVAEIAFSPDGSLVAAALKRATADGNAWDGDVCVWQTATGVRLSTLAGHPRGAERLAFSPDGALLLVTSGEATVSLWDPHAGTRCLTLPARTFLFPDVGALFGLAGSRLVSPDARLLDAVTGRAVTPLRPYGNITCLAVSPDGRRVAFGVASGNVYLHDIAAGKRIATLVGHAGAIRSAVFAPAGDRIVTGSLDGTARQWAVAPIDVDVHPLRQFHGHEGSVEATILSPDGRRLVTSATDGTVRVWEVATGRVLCVLPGQPDAPRAVALSPDGTLLVAAAAGSIRIHGLSNADVATARQAVRDPQ
jgi:WD40 repeat protein